MKALFIVFFGCLFSHGTADESSSFAQNMTPETVIAEAKSANTGAKATQLVEQVFQSKQLDLIAACFRAPNVHGIFVQEFVKLPAGQFKNEIVYTLLHERWPFDATPDRPYIGSMPPPIFEDACLEILAAQLPNEGLFVGDPRSFEKIRDVNYRVELARKLEAMVNPAKARTPTSREAKVLPEENDARKFNPISRASKDLASEPNAASIIPDTNPSSTTWPVVTVVIVAAMGLLWLLLKGSK